MLSERCPMAESGVQKTLRLYSSSTKVRAAQFSDLYYVVMHIDTVPNRDSRPAYLLRESLQRRYNRTLSANVTANCGSWANSTPHADARASAAHCENPSARAGGRER